MTGSQEKDLVTGLCNGNRKAFEQIFNLYHKRIYNFCIRLLHNRDSAEEVVQKLFVALWEQQKQLDESKPLAPYLFSVARYMVYQDFRQDAYRKAAFVEMTSNESVFKESTKDEVLFKELSDVLQKLINDLPDRQKEIFSLSRDSGLSYREIAGKLGITENTVDTQIRRALDHLRKEYKRYYT